MRNSHLLPPAALAALLPAPQPASTAPRRWPWALTAYLAAAATGRDDLGYSDVDMHGSSQIPTPYLAKLAANGAMLSSYYVQPVCSPTRATILSGRHVIHTGVYDPMNGGSGDLSLNFTLLPQHLGALGYTCHMVGKWCGRAAAASEAAPHAAD